MSQATATHSIQPGASPSVWHRGLSITVFAVLWVDLVRQLSYTWEANEQYAYGWFVPFQALALFWRRWLIRPDPQSFTPPYWLTVVMVFLLLGLLPVRVVHEINPDWPLVNWLHCLLVVGFSLYAVFLAGGWRWVRYFAFPICFVLVAVQWPYRIEHGLTQNLMQVVAGLTVEILGWFNVPALQRGNLIELSTGVLGVDEACSGIRSFQSTLMAALFLGELYLLRTPIRLLLVGVGLTAAFLLNVCRTLILTWQANAHGISAIDKWHDPAGFTIAVACFAVLWLLAVLIKKRWPVPEPHTSTIAPLGHQRGTGQGSSASEGSVGATADAGTSASRLQPSTFSFQTCRRYLVAVGCWSLLCIAATEGWYRAHALRPEDFTRWTLQLPESKPSFENIELPARTAGILAHDQGTLGKWDEADGSQWIVYCLRWNPTSMQSVIKARQHRPEICLTGAGLRQTSMSPLDYFAAGPLKMPFHKYTFEAGGQVMYVFFSLWQDGNEQEGMRTLDQGDRIKWVFMGRRGLGQQTLEIICTGYPNMATAEQAVRRRLPDLIRVERQASSASAILL